MWTFFNFFYIAHPSSTE